VLWRVAQSQYEDPEEEKEFQTLLKDMNELRKIRFPRNITPEKENWRISF
jgi:hypothetical protein